MRETQLDAEKCKDLLKSNPPGGLLPLSSRQITARIPHQSQKWVPKCPFLRQLLPGRSYFAPHSRRSAADGRRIVTTVNNNLLEGLWKRILKPDRSGRYWLD